MIVHVHRYFVAIRGPPLIDHLWFIGGKAHDLTDFVKKHPGGKDAILLGRGTDCTELFSSYHLLTAPGSALLARYEVPVNRDDPATLELLGSSRFTFNDGDFYKTVRGRVREYFRETKQKPGASVGVQIFAAVSILGAIALTFPAYVLGSLWGALLLGFVKAIASVGPGHSMSHFSLFPRGRWNALAFRIGSPFLVSSWSIWSASHVRSHHVDTLTHDDLQDNYPLKRIQPTLPHRPWHRGQHVYAWLVYMLGLPLWTLQDFVLSVVSLFTKKHMTNVFTLRQRVENTLAIAFNLVFSVGLPFFFMPFARALAVCLIANIASSLLVVIQIVVNHEVPETMGRTKAGETLDWGVHQVLTSHNFGVGSALALHMSGGLNMQIEHHLFPSVHYSHFPAIAPIVQRACAEFGLPYHESSSVFEAMAKHYRILKLNSVP